jgi:Tol biopolymer transport system component
VVFTSFEDYVVPDDMNGKSDLFLRDRELATTERLTLDDVGGEADEHAQGAVGISDDGRFVLFHHSSPLCAEDDDPEEWSLAKRRDVFLRDRQNGVNLLVSRAPDDFSDTAAHAVGLSPDGSRVLFFSGQTESYYDTSAYEWGTYYLTATREGSAFTFEPVIIPGGTDFVAQATTAADSHLVFSGWTGFTGYEDEHANGYVVDRATDEVTLVSAAEDGTTGIIHHVPEMWDPEVVMAVSDDGKRIAFTSIHNGIVDVPLPCAPPRQVYLRDCP